MFSARALVWGIAASAKLAAENTEFYKHVLRIV